jgi:DNA-binding MarR family transcriptional regulator
MSKHCPTELLSFRLIAIGESVRNLVQGSERRLSVPKLQVLYQFMRHDQRAHPAEISTALMWQSSRTVKDIKGLVKSGHLAPTSRTSESNEAIANDARLRPYALTPTGLDEAERFLHILESVDSSLAPLVSAHAEDGTKRLFRQLSLAAQICDFGSTESLAKAIDQGRLKKVRRHS